MRLYEIVCLLVTLASAAVILASLDGPGPAAPDPAPLPKEPAPAAGLEELRVELEVREARIADYEARLVAAEPPAPRVEEKPRAPRPKAPVEIPEAVMEAGRVLGVPGEALRAAWVIESAARRRVAAPGGREAFLAHGADGFRAMVAVIRGGYAATWQKPLLKSTWEPGLERLLIDMAEEEGAPQATALSFLGIADTEEVRRYLVERAGRDNDPARVYSAAEALADLREPRGAAAVEGKFLGPEWSGVRPWILDYLGRMGGREAGRILTDYLRDEDADYLDRAIGALRAIDPEAARVEARALLASPRAPFLRSLAVRALKKAAEEKR